MLSCGRWDLLSQSLDSFVRAMPQPTKIIIYDDITSKLGQAKALDQLLELGMKTDADWFVILEDDWIFEQDIRWFKDSYKILQEHPEVMLIGLSLTEGLRPHMEPGELSGIKIKWHNPWRLDEQHGYWYGWISSPRLMRRADWEGLPKFQDYIAEENFDQDVWRPRYNNGRRSIWLDHQYVRHIGYGRSLFPFGDKLTPTARTWQKSHR
jgi:hypothetical protein